MTYSTIISVNQLQQLMQAGKPLMVFDCSFDLGDPQLGREQYKEGHIAGAVYADLNQDLSEMDPRRALNGGRHPLPEREKLVQWLRSLGFDNDMQAVVYDRQGVNFCGRLWWLLQWLGHEAVAVLDGGWAHWQAAGAAVEVGAGAAAVKQGNFQAGAPLRQWLNLAQVRTALDAGQLAAGGTHTVVDARGAPRYTGEAEPLDPVAGHIPGALNRPFTMNFGVDGLFKPATLLKAEFEALLQGRKIENVIHQCGSGVSAVPNLLAMEIAGLGCTQLFAGSWSEWSRQVDCPVEKGAGLKQ